MKKMLLFLFLLLTLSLFARPAIMLTGYWAPTSEMMYRFSNDPELNPEGWIGEDWEGYGYDVYAFFPAFDIPTREFEVDYQATWEDFWATVDEIHPEMIISYGAGNGEWEIEHRSRNLSSWYADYEAPYYPTPNPPDGTVEVNFERFSTLPKERIKAAVNEQTEINAWVDYNGNPGGFLCEYIAYLGMWYHDIHADPEDEFYCQSAGFIHVNAGVNLAEATEAVEVTLRTTIEYFQNLMDLEGMVTVNSELTEPCQIQLTDEFSQTYDITTDIDGSFSYEGFSAGVYDIVASSGRYFYYEGTAVIDLENDFLEIHLDEFLPSELLTWCDGAEQLINNEPVAVSTIGSYFSPEILNNYLGSHLKSFGFTAPEDSENCSVYLKLYRGNPLGEGELLELYSSSMTDFATGDYVEFEVTELEFIDAEYIQEGLTVGCVVVNSNYNLGWMDNGPANPNGNLIKIGPNWVHADEQYGMTGNWDLRLGFNELVDSAPDEVIPNSIVKLSNYPNPFNPNTEIRFTAKDAPDAKVDIYNIKGQKINSIVCHPEPVEGDTKIYSVTWNGTDHNNTPVSSGIYFAVVKKGNSILASRKMMLLK